MPPTLEEDDYHDTIVIKGEYHSHWSRPSSPESMNNEIELEPQVVANLLAQINTPRHLESPEPLDEDVSTPNVPSDRPDLQLDQASSRLPRQRHRPNVTTMEERLMMMPERRPLPWRDGVEPGADNETGGESRRKQIRFGCLLATRGDIQEVPCNSCANGRGKFKVCVALEGYFKGACASCQLSGRPNRCSIKKNDGDDVLSTPGGEASSRTHSQPHIPSEGPQSKRRRVTDPIPEWESARPQWEQELGDSQARQHMNEIIQRPWTTVNSPATMPIPTSQTMNEMNSPGTGPPRTLEQRNSMAWASVNQPTPLVGPQTYERAASTAGSHRNLEQARREETVINEEGSSALIDALPKSKQRQVYGLISGLQGGIEHLQRELDSLKRALGIDDED
ncbi:hypothetical protein L207DRAFT_551109 [Hyaloscypha variabilis F]|uniref:Uncharacterized protein n=1 Tax=Hyaloscypha variabilis (strain UAMH 11265 / GT02V1 / F) TaxID=1149755 RepID=A0A2J6SA05_HYAVF|nr:hypothetical protein L207DRAFT_551109 [Hyaloscypha variabilis F]